MMDLMNMASISRKLVDAGRVINRSRFETRGNCVLNGDQAISIRAEYGPGKASYRMLAAKYGVDYTTIRRVIKRTSWTWV